MRGTMIVGVSAALLAACGSHKSDDSGKGTFTVDQSSGGAKLTIKDDKGHSLEINSGEAASGSMPKGYTVYPGARVVSNSNVAQGEGSAAMVLMQSNDPPDKVATYYLDEAEAAGVKIALDEQVGGGRMLSGKAADGQEFTLQASPEGSGTSVSLMVGQGASQ